MVVPNVSVPGSRIKRPVDRRVDAGYFRRAFRYTRSVMAGKLCPKVILEGTRLTLKTEIAFALNESPEFVGPRAYRYHSPIVSAEWCGFTNVPWGRGLINFLPEEREQAMETFATWMRLFELLRYYSWIVDRFHLSTRLYQLAEQGIDYDFEWLEERLAAVGFHLVICVRSAESFAEAREERLRVSGKPSQYDDLEKFVREQETLLELSESSLLPRRIVDVSDGKMPRITGEIESWMSETGGLWAT
ncbi:MAG: hypothetical protein WBO69_17635 [Thermoanaerobaculia bacterium]